MPTPLAAPCSGSLSSPSWERITTRRGRDHLVYGNVKRGWGLSIACIIIRITKWPVDDPPCSGSLSSPSWERIGWGLARYIYICINIYKYMDVYIYMCIYMYKYIYIYIRYCHDQYCMFNSGLTRRLRIRLVTVVKPWRVVRATTAPSSSLSAHYLAVFSYSIVHILEWGVYVP